MIDNISNADTMYAAVLRLLAKGWTSPLLALQEANCLSLSQRAGQAIREGLPIEKRWTKTPTGKTVREYRLVTALSLARDRQAQNHIADAKEMELKAFHLENPGWARLKPGSNPGFEQEKP